MADAAGGLRLTVIGSAAAWATRGGRPSSCYLVEHGDDAIVLDLGQGAFAALAERRAPESLLGVVISHLHPDHHVDLVAMRHYLRFGLTGPGGVRRRAVALHAPGELRARYDAFLGEEPFLEVMPGDDVREGTWSIGPFAIEARPVTHALNSFAFRVSTADDRPPGDGAAPAPALVYSGDCGRWEDLVPLIRPGDTLLCEAFWGTVGAEADEMHLVATEAAQAAREGRAGQLILTHLAATADPHGCRRDAAAIFDGPISVAEPGLSVRIG